MDETKRNEVLYMKKILTVFMAIALMVSVCACGAKTEGGAEATTPAIDTSTVGGKYLKAFADSTATNTAAVVEELLGKDIFDAAMMQNDVEPGYLAGFSEDITGFKSGTQFAPMIGSIPFVGYVLEADEPQALLDQLTKAADPRWNICTEADETVSMIRGSLVFFLMCTND